MVDVYHELSDPPAVLAAVRASLKPRAGSRSSNSARKIPTVPILPLHKMSQAQVMREIPANGFKLVGQFDNLPWQHVLFFARDDSPLAGHRAAALAGRTYDCDLPARALHHAYASASKRLGVAKRRESVSRLLDKTCDISLT